MIDDLLRDPAGALQMLLLMVPGLLAGRHRPRGRARLGRRAPRGPDGAPRGPAHAQSAARTSIRSGALAFVLAGFGWARPVPVNARNLRRPVRDMACVAAAGPALELSSWPSSVSSCLVLATRTRESTRSSPGRWEGCSSYVYTFNLGLAIFNLIPLPPLDGGHFLPYFFPRRSWPLLARLEQYGPLILLLLVFSGATRYIVGPLFGLGQLHLRTVTAL